LKWWIWKCRRFDSDQMRTWFKQDWLDCLGILPMFRGPISNRVGNPDQCKACIGAIQTQYMLHWTILHNFSSNEMNFTFFLLSSGFESLGWAAQHRNNVDWGCGGFSQFIENSLEEDWQRWRWRKSKTAMIGR
jgi:hypothetical protein